MTNSLEDKTIAAEALLNGLAFARATGKLTPEFERFVLGSVGAIATGRVKSVSMKAPQGLGWLGRAASAGYAGKLTTAIGACQLPVSLRAQVTALIERLTRQFEDNRAILAAHQ